MHRDGKAPLISVEQLADELGVSVRYVRRIIAERRIPYVKVGLRSSLELARHRRPAEIDPLAACLTAACRYVVRVAQPSQSSVVTRRMNVIEVGAGAASLMTANY